MNDIQVVIPLSTEIVKNAFERHLATGTRIFKDSPLEIAVREGLEECREHITSTVKSAVNDLVASEEFKEALRKAVQNAMVNESVKIGQRVARSLAMKED